MTQLAELKRAMQRQASPVKAKASTWFFKTNPGDYGHGDKFLGLTVPEQRQLAKRYRELPIRDVLALLKSPWHEHRLTAVIILSDQFRRGDERKQKKIVDQYLKHTKFVNNWDIVDSSAPYILGTWLLNRPRVILVKLAKSKVLWERRIAIVSTQMLIRHGHYDDTFKLAAILLKDNQALMHKATGWMLREVGDRDKAALVKFLNRHAKDMPRTMLRYAIEKFPDRTRKKFLGMKP